jgi:hypothetical protein
VFGEIIKLLRVKAGKFLRIQPRAKELGCTGGGLSRIIPSGKRQNEDWLTERWLFIND